MKKLKYIYTLITVVLLSTVIYSCDDSSMFITEEVDTAESSSNGETVKTTFTVGISAPNVSGDLDVATRAGGDNANIEYAKPENGGRFQNLIVVLTDHNDKIYGVECREYNDGVGRKDEEVIFSDIEVPTDDVNKQNYKVYAFGNVCTLHYNAFKGDTASAHESIKGDLSNRKTISDLSIYANCITSNISVSDPYQINFEQGKTYNVGSSSVSSTGMPVNNMVSATVKKGNTQFNVAMKRVCARLQVTFRNFTGTYKDYESGDNKDNNVYVDKFVLKGVLASSTNYFYNGSDPSTGSVDFDILKALGGSKTNDHIINKIENGKDLVVSMYVFENKKGTTTGAYTYDLKVDRGKSLGKNTTTIQPGNSYVIWNNQAHQSLAIKNNVICTVEQNSMVDIPFNEQVFWQIESAPDSKLADTYVLNHCLYNSSTDKATPENKYLQQQPDPTDWGMHFYCSKCRKTVDILHYINLTHISSISYTLVDSEFSHIFTSSAATSDGNAQYVNFVLKGGLADSEESRYTFNLLNKSDKKKNQNYWETVGSNYRYLFLTVKDDNNLGCVRGMAYNTSQTLGEYDWTLYAKYIIKNGETFSTGTGTSKTAISQIDRNHSYELDFSVMPNYETKQELVVSCVRTQNEINWSEVEK